VGDEPPFRPPVFVVAHPAGAPLVKQGGTTHHFVTGGIAPALERAQATAEDGDVMDLGGADLIR
jgi:dihydrofolate reductase